MSRAPLAFATLLVALGAPLTAADLAEASRTMSGRLEESLAAYKEQSARIAEERIPLIREISALEDENITLRTQIQTAARLSAGDTKASEALKNRLDELKAQTDFSLRFLQEYLDSFESRIHVAEDQHYKDRLTALRLELEKAGADPVAAFEQHAAVVGIGLERAEKLVGGTSFKGRAIASDGVVKEGTVALVGPLAYFATEPGDADPAAGLLQFRSGTIEPSLVVPDRTHASGIARFVQSGAGALALDASQGSAIALQTANIRIVDHISRGGPVGYAILLLGAVALILSCVKLADLGRFKTIESRSLNAIIREAVARNEPAALAQVGKVGGPVGEMLELGVRNLHANSVLLEELMLSVILRRRPEVERFLPFLAITAAAAPLLGLLGTVVGMIRTFALITVFGTGDPRALSAGISEALVTTELGLMVAIPTLVLHGVFTRMIKSRFGDMERVAFEFVKTLALEESKKPKA